MYAIGVYEGGKTQTKIKLVKILNVDDAGEEFLGTTWCNTQQLEIGKPYLVTFEPADQFCNAISLTDLENIITARISNRKKFETAH